MPDLGIIVVFEGVRQTLNSLMHAGGYFREGLGCVQPDKSVFILYGLQEGRNGLLIRTDLVQGIGGP